MRLFFPANYLQESQPVNYNCYDNANVSSEVVVCRVGCVWQCRLDWSRISEQIVPSCEGDKGDVQKGKAETRGSFLLLKPGAGGLTRKKGLLPQKQQSTHNSGLAASTCSAGPLLFLCFCVFLFYMTVSFIAPAAQRVGRALFSTRIIIFNSRFQSKEPLFTACTCSTGMPQGSTLGPLPFFTQSSSASYVFFYLTTTMQVKFPFSTQVELESWAEYSANH